VVMRSKNVVADDADGAGAEGGRRPTAVPAPCAATEMSVGLRRRTFTVQMKLRTPSRHHARCSGLGTPGPSVGCYMALEST
jgi:hypothetical protein